MREVHQPIIASPSVVLDFSKAAVGRPSSWPHPLPPSPPKSTDLMLVDLDEPLDPARKPDSPTTAYVFAEPSRASTTAPDTVSEMTSLSASANPTSPNSIHPNHSTPSSPDLFASVGPPEAEASDDVVDMDVEGEGAPTVSGPGRGSGHPVAAETEEEQRLVVTAEEEDLPITDTEGEEEEKEYLDAAAREVERKRRVEIKRGKMSVRKLSPKEKKLMVEEAKAMEEEEEERRMDCGVFGRLDDENALAERSRLREERRLDRLWNLGQCSANAWVSSYKGWTKKCEKFIVGHGEVETDPRKFRFRRPALSVDQSARIVLNSQPASPISEPPRTPKRTREDEGACWLDELFSQEDLEAQDQILAKFSQPKKWKRPRRESGGGSKGINSLEEPDTEEVARQKEILKRIQSEKKDKELAHRLHFVDRMGGMRGSAEPAKTLRDADNDWEESPELMLDGVETDVAEQSRFMDRIMTEQSDAEIARKLQEEYDNAGTANLEPVRSRKRSVKYDIKDDNQDDIVSATSAEGDAMRDSDMDYAPSATSKNGKRRRTRRGKGKGRETPSGSGYRERELHFRCAVEGPEGGSEEEMDLSTSCQNLRKRVAEDFDENFRVKEDRRENPNNRSVSVQSRDKPQGLMSDIVREVNKSKYFQGDAASSNGFYGKNASGGGGGGGCRSDNRNGSASRSRQSRDESRGNGSTKQSLEKMLGTLRPNNGFSETSRPKTAHGRTPSPEFESGVGSGHNGNKTTGNRRSNGGGRRTSRREASLDPMEGEIIVVYDTSEEPLKRRQVTVRKTD